VPEVEFGIGLGRQPAVISRQRFTDAMLRRLIADGSRLTADHHSSLSSLRPTPAVVAGGKEGLSTLDGMHPRASFDRSSIWNGVPII
jgi:hypothetical protein